MCSQCHYRILYNPGVLWIEFWAYRCSKRGSEWEFSVLDLFIAQARPLHAPCYLSSCGICLPLAFITKILMLFESLALGSYSFTRRPLAAGVGTGLPCLIVISGQMKDARASKLIRIAPTLRPAHSRRIRAAAAAQRLRGVVAARKLEIPARLFQNSKRAC